MLPMGHGHRDHRADGPHRRLAAPRQGARHHRRGGRRLRPGRRRDRAHQHRPEPGAHRARGRPGRARPPHRVAPGARRQPGHLRRPPRSSAADRDGVLPAGFYSTTNLATDVLHRRRVGGRREPGDGLRPRRRRRAGARTIPMHRVRVGDQIVVGSGGVRVHAPVQAAGRLGVRVHEQRGVARRSPRRSSCSRSPTGSAPPTTPAARCSPCAARRWCTPAARPTSPASSRPAGSTCSSPATASPPTTSRRNVLGTSLGVLLAEGTLTEGGHSNHLRVINEVRRHGSIAAAVEAGLRHRRRHGHVRAQGRAVRARRLDPRRRSAARRLHRTPPPPPTPCASSSPACPSR